MRKQSIMVFTSVILAISFLIWGCGGGGGSSTIVVKSMKISPTTATVFSNEEVTFHASGGDLPYTWASGDASLLVLVPEKSATDGSFAVFQGIGSGSTTVSVHDTGGRQATATVTVTQKNPRVVPTEASAEFTGNENPTTVTFRASGGYKPYTWAVSNAAVAVITGASTGVEEVTVETRGIGSVSITVFDDFQSSASGTLYVTGQSPRVVPERAVIGLSGAVTFTASQGAAPYSWEVQDLTLGSLDKISSQENEQVTFTASSTTEGSTFIKVTDAAGLTFLASIEVQRLTPIIFPSQAYLENGETLLLRAAGGTLPYVWANDSPSVGTLVLLSNTTAQFTASETISTGTATITVEDGAGRTDTAQIVVSGAFTVQPLSVTVQPTDTVTFSVFGGTSPYSAVVNDTRVAQASDITITGTQVTVKIRDTAPAGPGYVLSVFDANGSIAAASIVVEAQVAP